MVEHSATHRSGYRGYIGSRPYMGERTAQHVQNLVIRDYCQRKGFIYLLSATEYAMENCYIMLEEVLREVDAIEGIAMYSLFMLPARQTRREAVYERALGKGVSIHGALENLAIATPDDVQRVEDILKVNLMMQARPPMDQILEQLG
jgi:sporadic carbohydrate cluster protein (TIGR04323 family)